MECNARAKALLWVLSSESSVSVVKNHKTRGNYPLLTSMLKCINNVLHYLRHCLFPIAFQLRLSGKQHLCATTDFACRCEDIPAMGVFSGSNSVLYMLPAGKSCCV